MMMKKILALILALAMCLTFTACGDEETVVEIEMPVEEEAAPVEAEVSSDGSWAVYWYLCGSDLETNYACATTDLQEMLEVAARECERGNSDRRRCRMAERADGPLQDTALAVQQRGPAACGRAGDNQHGRCPDTV